MTLNVVPFPIANLNDIPAMLRKFADAIEAGEYGEVTTVLTVLEHGDGFESFGWGEAGDNLRNAGLLMLAHNMQLEMATGE